MHLRIPSLLVVVLLLLLWPSPALAQQGWLWNLTLYGYTFPTRELPPDSSGTSLGSVRTQVYLVNNIVGYQPNRYLLLAADLPVFLVNFCQTPPGGSRSCLNTTGMGDAGLYLQIRFENPAVNFYSTGTLRLPTGDENQGLGTGFTTASWSNTLSRRIQKTTPFLTATLANSVSHTSSFVLPIVNRDLVVELGGGLEQEITRSFHLGGLAYLVVPRKSDPSISGDNGVWVWLRFPVHRHVQFQVSYTRSMGLDVDFFSYGLHLNLAGMLRGR